MPKRQKVYQLRLNSKEYNRLMGYASQAGVSAAELLRDYIKQLPLLEEKREKINFRVPPTEHQTHT